MIRTIADLQAAPSEVVAHVLATLDLRGTVLRQMKIDGRRRSVTLGQYEEMVEGLRPHTCAKCEGRGQITPHLRTVGCIHPSSAHRCVLAQYYGVLAEHEVEEEISPELQMIFEIGHALHAVVQQCLHRALPEQFEDEVSLDLMEAMVQGGHADGLVDMYDYRYVLEIKTISGDGYAKLTKPKAEHILQASIYCKALDVPFIGFLYINKATGGMKQYPVAFDQRLYEDWLRTKIRPIERALETGKEPIADANKYECATCAHGSHCTQKLQGGHDPFKR